MKVKCQQPKATMVVRSSRSLRNTMATFGFRSLIRTFEMNL